MKINEPKFSAIPQFTRTSSYAVHWPWNYMESALTAWEKSYGVELQPDFQRAHVWDEKKQRAFIEFVLRGGKSSNDLYWNSPAFGHPSKECKLPETIVLVDGLQRLTAARKFMNNELKVFGYYFKDFTDHLSITQARFYVHVNDLETKKEVLQWYLDLNRGGVAHTDEEIKKVEALLKKEK